MIDGIEILNQRERAIITGIYLSKFDKAALNEFGFDTFRQAFNVLGYATGTKPSSVKLYRDEFDSYFPNNRHGWNRGVRDYCKNILKEVDGLSFDEFSNLVKAIVTGNKDIILPGKRLPKSTFSVQRLITGEAAEQYFTSVYGDIPQFIGYTCHNTTKTGCGFDFKLSRDRSFFCIEVKGLNDRKGSIMMTEKEYETAKDVGETYCLFVVRNFKEKPEHSLFFNPANNADLTFRKQETNVVRISYNAAIP